jgi:hydrogenase nickel incorporation protein HypA/HybF
MHELSIAEALVAAVRRELGALPPASVRRVRVRVGALRLVEPTALQFCYAGAARENGLEQSELILEPVAARAACRRCGAEFAIEEPVFLCPRCDSADVQILAGNELTLVGIECAAAEQPAGCSVAEAQPVSSR